MKHISEIVNKYKQENLLTTSDVVSLLGLSRERVRQLISNKVLSPKYVFNANSKRKQYIFDRELVNNYISGKVSWVEPETTSLLSIPEINNILQCSLRWVYDMTRRGKIKPSLVAGDEGSKLICLYDIEAIHAAWQDRKSQGGNKGYRQSTLALMKDIRILHGQGLNDSDIARQLDKKQPLISKLRKQAGLFSLCRRGRPRKGQCKIEHTSPVSPDIPF